MPAKSVFEKIGLPINPPFAPMEAKRVEEIPPSGNYQYEPKWDGFRAIIFREGANVIIQSKSGLPLHRYFPELVENIRKIKTGSFVIDGEIVLVKNGRLSFDDLQLRVHPAQSRIDRLSLETPVTYKCFDLLYWKDVASKTMVAEPLSTRRSMLERFFKKVPEKIGIDLSPATLDEKKARKWFTDYAKLGLDGIIAKLVGEKYHSGDRKGMLKVKHLKSADCVVAGYRKGTKKGSISALTLGLYDEQGNLNHVGSTSSFNAAEKAELYRKLKPLEGGPGFTGKAPAKSRWSQGSKDDHEFVAVKAKLVCEVRYDYFTQGRFRHSTKFLRWRTDKSPRLCKYDQL